MCDTNAGCGTGSDVFPVDGGVHRLEVWLRAIQLSPYSAGPATHRPERLARPLLSWHALVPFTFRIQVSHQTQELPSEFLPAALGIQQGASRRSGHAADRARRGHHALLDGVGGAYVLPIRAPDLAREVPRSGSRRIALRRLAPSCPGLPAVWGELLRQP